MRKKRILEAFKAHKLTLRETAEALEIDYWDLQELLYKEGIPISDMTAKEAQESMKLADELARKMKGAKAG